MSTQGKQTSDSKVNRRTQIPQEFTELLGKELGLSSHQPNGKSKAISTVPIKGIVIPENILLKPQPDTTLCGETERLQGVGGKTKVSSGPQGGQPNWLGHHPPSSPAWAPDLHSSTEIGSPRAVNQ